MSQRPTAASERSSPADWVWERGIIGPALVAQMLSILIDLLYVAGTDKLRVVKIDGWA